MSDQTTVTRKCARCRAAIERCAFCDEPDCPAITCYRCLLLAFLDRLRPRSTTSAPTRN
jgi:hypothetical protein